MKAEEAKMDHWPRHPGNTTVQFARSVRLTAASTGKNEKWSWFLAILYSYSSGVRDGEYRNVISVRIGPVGRRRDCLPSRQDAAETARSLLRRWGLYRTQASIPAELSPTKEAAIRPD